MSKKSANTYKQRQRRKARKSANVAWQTSVTTVRDKYNADTR